MFSASDDQGNRLYQTPLLPDARRVPGNALPFHLRLSNKDVLPEHAVAGGTRLDMLVDWVSVEVKHRSRERRRRERRGRAASFSAIRRPPRARMPSRRAGSSRCRGSATTSASDHQPSGTTSIGSDTPADEQCDQDQQDEATGRAGRRPGVQPAPADLADGVRHHQQRHREPEEAELGDDVDEEVVTVDSAKPARA